jgi:hypothetical protein
MEPATAAALRALDAQLSKPSFEVVHFIDSHLERQSLQQLRVLLGQYIGARRKEVSDFVLRPPPAAGCCCDYTEYAVNVLEAVLQEGAENTGCPCCGRRELEKQAAPSVSLQAPVSTSFHTQQQWCPLAGLLLTISLCAPRSL